MNWDALYERVRSDAPLADSPEHGTKHWTQVATNGLTLMVMGAPGDGFLVMLFALLHDSQRVNEFHDPGHGVRAEQYMRRLCAQGWIVLDEQRQNTLGRALAGHDRDRRFEIPTTIGLCWDADRLDLPRVGITPDVEYLSTPQARQLVSSLDNRSESGII